MSLPDLKSKGIQIVSAFENSQTFTSISDSFNTLLHSKTHGQLNKFKCFST